MDIYGQTSLTENYFQIARTLEHKEFPRSAKGCKKYACTANYGSSGGVAASAAASAAQDLSAQSRARFFSSFPKSSTENTKKRTPLFKDRGVDRPSKKKRKKKNFKTLVCHQFEATGQCPYGDKCMYAHGKEELLEGLKIHITAARKLLREQAAQRALIGTANDQVPFSNAGIKTLYGDVITRHYTQLFHISSRDPAATQQMKEHKEKQLKKSGVIAQSLAEEKLTECRDEDQYCNMHSNNLCVIGVAPTHSLFANDRKVVHVEFHVNCEGISGKKKRGAVNTTHDLNICTVTCSDGTRWPIKAAVPGRLIEINERLVENVNLLNDRKAARMEGFVCIISPRKEKTMLIQESLLSKVEYEILRSTTK
eukprot:g3609.t1